MSFSIDDIEEDNVNQDDYLRDEFDEEVDTKEQESELGSESSKSDTINTIVTQISELDEDKTGAVVQLDDTPNDA